MPLIFIILCFFTFLNAKILKATAYGDAGLKIAFSHKVELDKIPLKRLDKKVFYIDLKEELAFKARRFAFPHGTRVRIAHNRPGFVRIAILTKKKVRLDSKDRDLYITFLESSTKSKPASNQSIKNNQTAQGAQKSAVQEKISSAQRALSKRPDKRPAKKPNSKAKLIVKNGYRVMIDPGHGGKDCGAKGVQHVCEKEIVLEVSLILQKDLIARGYTVFMTRTKDIYVDLKRRTEIANEKKADLFVSIHANSLPEGRRNVKGVETYFLSTARSKRAEDVAAAENKGDIETLDYFSRYSFLNALNSQRLLASNKLAIDIQFGILKSLRTEYSDIEDGGVKEGPFWVLAGALMPSVLIELGYNSHETEAFRLINSNYQRLLAAGIADGIDGFVEKNF